MGKISAKRVTATERKALARLLASFIGQTRDRRSRRRFLDLFLAPSEVIMFGRRVRVAERLRAGKTVDAIERELHVGQATIERVRRWVRAEHP